MAQYISSSLSSWSRTPLLPRPSMLVPQTTTATIPALATVPSPSASASPFRLTLQIVRLVKRAKARVRSRAGRSAKDTRTRLARQGRRDSCLEFERRAFESVDRYLGKNRGGVYGKGRIVTEEKVDKVLAEEDLDRLLAKLNASVTFRDHELTTVAKDNSLLLDRKTDFHIEKLSVRELAELILVAKELLVSVSRLSARSHHIRTICEGNELLDTDIDVTYLANLEHLLLCLQYQLVHQFIAHFVDEVQRHISESQQDQHRHSEDWFFEFPDSRHPLSTTWPWSIRPSLAVIWGVCWMFYDFLNNSNGLYRINQNGDMCDVEGYVVVPREAVQQYVLGMQRWQQQRERAAMFYPSTNDPAPRQTFGQLAFPPIMMTAEGRHLPSADVAESAAHHLSGRAGAPLPVATSSPSSDADAGDFSLGPTGASSNSPAQPAAHTPAASSQWWPQVENFASSGVQQPDEAANAYPAGSGLWPSLPPHTSSYLVPEQQPFATVGYNQALPPRSQNTLTPSIRVINDPTGPGFYSSGHQTPQDNVAYYSAPSTSPMSHQEDGVNYAPQPYPSIIPQQDPRYMPQDPTTNNNGNMHTPVSPVSPSGRSPHDPNIDEPMSRKRSHSQMRDEAPQQPSADHSRNGPTTSGMHHEVSPVADDYTSSSPRGSRTFKRGEPPLRGNKYYCNFATECAGQLFDRKCEWSKHMDKHDRPYRCPHPACAKLQGFTYSGGLLRHEREVHGKHGGPKSQMMCPYEDCKRHSGKGFTRKENLMEHIRRVHETNKPSQQMSQSQTQSQLSQQPSQADNIFSTELQQTAQGAEQINELLEQPPPPPIFTDTKPADDFEQAQQPLPLPLQQQQQLGKRSHSEIEDGEPSVQDAREEIKRLRTMNADKDDRLRELEAAQAMSQSQIQQLQQELYSLRQSLQQPPPPAEVPRSEEMAGEMGVQSVPV